MPERPNLTDFLERVGQPFTVTPVSGGAPMEWILDSCTPHETPDVPELRGKDFYSLAFTAPTGLGQSIYALAAADGFRTELFAIPYRPGGMSITVA